MEQNQCPRSFPIQVKIVPWPEMAWHEGEKGPKSYSTVIPYPCVRLDGIVAWLRVIGEGDLADRLKQDAVS